MTDDARALARICLDERVPMPLRQAAAAELWEMIRPVWELAVELVVDAEAATVDEAQLVCQLAALDGKDSR